MNRDQYNKRIAEALRATRALCCKTQKDVVLNVTIPQCTYSKIETGQRPADAGELYVIAKEMGTSIFQLAAFAESKNEIDPLGPTLSEMLVRFVKEYKGGRSYEEIAKIIETIRHTFGIEKPNSLL